MQPDGAQMASARALMRINFGRVVRSVHDDADAAFFRLNICSTDDLKTSDSRSAVLIPDVNRTKTHDHPTHTHTRAAAVLSIINKVSTTEVYREIHAPAASAEMLHSLTSDLRSTDSLLWEETKRDSLQQRRNMCMSVCEGRPALMDGCEQQLLPLSDQFIPMLTLWCSERTDHHHHHHHCLHCALLHLRLVDHRAACFVLTESFHRVKNFRSVICCDEMNSSHRGAAAAA